MAGRVFLKTGEFARLCGVTRDTLLHYDRKDIFHPSHVSENGYRRYGIEQYFEFDLISILKETGGTLEEIRRCLQSHSLQSYTELIRESVQSLKARREQLTRRENMLRRLLDLTEETYAAKFDELMFEDRREELVTVFPVDPEKMTSIEGSVECYAACLEHDLTRGNTVDAPIGMLIPMHDAVHKDFRPSFFFTAAYDDEKKAVRRISAGRCGVWFHRGDMPSHVDTFRWMMEKLGEKGMRVVGDVWIYDQMDYLLSRIIPGYVAKYSVLVESMSGGE